MEKSLAVKYRPHDFNSVIEQDAVKIILKQQLESGSIHQAMLFCGPSGDGKTTTARILANELNKGLGNPIEMDAASHNSVDDVRDIIKMASSKTIDGATYKVFIIDECFPGNTLVKTPTSEKRISDIVSGDIVESMSGNKVVTHVFKNRVLTDRLCCVTVNNRKIITTVEHLFFTNHGWITASQLQKGDIVYGSEDLQELWERVCKETGQRREVLFKQLCNQVSLSKPDRGTKTESAERRESMPYMPAKVYSEGNIFTEDLLSRLQKQTYYEVEQTVDEYRVWDGTSETVIRKNVKRQSNEVCSKHTEDAGNEREEWNTSSMAYSAGWKREVYDSTDRLMESIRTWMGVRISNKHEESELERDEVTLVLQSRPWLFREEVGDRGRWSRPQVEKFIIEGCEKNRSPRNARVESVEIYKRGYNDELFRGSFTDSELSSGYVTMYDLEVDGDHSYFVEDCLVHNCHSLSNTGWQAFLKCIEEPPAKVVFIFCTTDPQKLPATILSRVQRFQFQKVSTKGIADRLDYILSQEMTDDMTANRDAIEYIAKLADGGMRLAIQYLEKCLAYSDDLTTENVVKALNVTDYSDFMTLSDLILSENKAELIKKLDEIYASGVDFKQFLKQYISFILDVNKTLILDDLNEAFKYIDLPRTSEVESWLKSILKHGDLTSYNKLLSHLVKLDADVKYSQNPKVDIIAGLLLFEV